MAFLSAQDLPGISLGIPLYKRFWIEYKLQKHPKETKKLACSHPIVWGGEKIRREEKICSVITMVLKEKEIDTNQTVS